MALEIDIFPDLFDLAIGADEDGAAEDAHKFFAVAFSFAPEAQLLQHHMADIGQERKIQVMFLGKGLMRSNIIGANAIDGDIQGSELRNSITEFRSFNRSAIGVIFGVGKDDIALTKQLGWRNFTCRVRRQGEIGQRLADF